MTANVYGYTQYTVLSCSTANVTTNLIKEKEISGEWQQPPVGASICRCMEENRCIAKQGQLKNCNFL